MTSNAAPQRKEQAPAAPGVEEQAPAPAASPPASEARRKHHVKLPHVSPHRRRALLFLSLLALLLAGWWVSGYLFAYTDDAYLTSDVVSMTPEVTGPIKAVHVSDNQWVTRGTPLFTIDPVPFELALDQAQAQEAQAQAQLATDQAQIAILQAQKQSADAAANLATNDLRRDIPLGASGSIPVQTFDKVRTTQEESAAQQLAAQAALRKEAAILNQDQIAVVSAHATRLLAAWRLSRTNVVASVDGYVTSLTLQPGDMVTPDTAAMALVDTHAWHVIANYKEYYLRHFAPGHIAWIWLDTDPWHLYRARVEGMAHGINRQQGGAALVPYVSPTMDWIRLQRRIPVRLTLLNPPGDAQLFMGADARVLIVY